MCGGKTLINKLWSLEFGFFPPFIVYTTDKWLTFQGTIHKQQNWYWIKQTALQCRLETSSISDVGQGVFPKAAGADSF